MSMNNKTTIHSLAGYCNEKVLWKLLVDLSSEVLIGISEDRKVLMPDIVIIDGDDFHIDLENIKKQETEFYPPEGIKNYGEAGYVWSLGALVCYASSGHFVFGGRGGAYQHSNPKVELPTLRKEHSALSAIVKRCLCHSPSQRINLKELHTLALKGLDSNNQASRMKRLNNSNESNNSPGYSEDIWPEKMG